MEIINFSSQNQPFLRADPSPIEDNAEHPAFQSPNEKIKSTRNFALQLQLLLKKNILIQKRSLRTLGFQLLMPLLICVVIYILQISANGVVGEAVENPPISAFEKVPRCFYRPDSPNNCSTIVYGVIGTAEPWMKSVMQYVAKDNGLTEENDVKNIGEIQPSSFQQYLHNNTNQTQLGVIFCNTNWTITQDLVIPCSFSQKTSKKLVFYSIVYNVTELLASIYSTNFQGVQPTSPAASSLKMSLDSAIFSYFSIDKEGTGNLDLELNPEDENMPKIRNATKQEYPRSFLRFFIGIDIVTATGALQFFVPYMIHFIFTVIEIIREKEKRLRQGLAVMGMSHSAYWISWFFTSMMVNLLITCMTVGMGLCFGYQFFTQTPVPITLQMFFLFGQALQGLAFWITTICSDSKTGYTVAFSILLVSVVLQAFLATSYISFMFFLKDPPIWFIPIQVFFELIPSYNFAVIFGRITLLSGRHYDLNDNYWKQGPGFTYHDLLTSQTASLAGLEIQVPKVIFFYIILLGNAVLYLLLTWYFDNVVAHNRGTGKSLIFCLKRRAKLSNLNIIDDIDRVHTESSGRQMSEDYVVEEYDGYTSESVRKERENMIRKAREEPENGGGLRIINLTKSYIKSTRNPSKNVHALKHLYMGIQNGELLGLLGPNGAGKTTLIGLLTGLLSPSEGTAIIDGLDIRTHIDKVREIIGVCPQFDILWDELTAEEHLYMFARLKKIPLKDIPDEIDQRLREVNLYDMKKVVTRAFSGGMKRRLSIAIALIGNPKIVFLDEPTTGMDPKNRQYIWQMIQKMKKGRAVMLTTHAMEEADALSDRIAIIMTGQLRCIGTPLFLKNEYGDGYRLSLIVDKQDIQGTIDYIMKKIPSARIVDSSGGSIIVGIPLAKKKELQGFLRIVEEENATAEKAEFKRRIKDWSLRHSTLEEVFMKVFQKSKKEESK